MSNKNLQLQKSKVDCIYYREVADKIWELSKEYEEKGMFELSSELKNISSNIHDLARLKESYLQK